MTNSSVTAPTNFSKFQGLFRKLFQFDCADLDFGIYRIMNHKRGAVERFINEQLPATIATELDRGPLAQQAQAEAKLEEVRYRIKATLGENAIDDEDVLAEAHHDLPIGKEYLEAQLQVADGSRSRDAVEAAIYNHLYTFFSRYYEDGDFISKRRYSRNQRYAIPYNGEEVYLHWANSDQYYVKSDEYFRNYGWKAPNGVAVHFRLKNADVEQDNVKGDRRFFIPRVAETEWDAGGNAITIPFEYRPLSGSEIITHGKKNRQESIVQTTVSAISKHLHGNAQAIAALMGEHRRNGDDPNSHLEHHLHRYVRRNNSDFFIHKDLSGFLNRELDFYLKNEVLNLDNLVTAGQNMTEGWFQQMRLIKAVGSQIIDFLAQIEGFQKMLWEKRKFVTETQYCIRVGIIDEVFYDDIAECDAQWDEWEDQCNVSDKQKDLFCLGASIQENRLNILKEQTTLVLDTIHFQQEFVDRLLSCFEDLDGMSDGLLVHGENWQALSLLKEKYQRRVKCVYIDPPYNTAASEILYKNDYKHSSWLSLIADRLSCLPSFFEANSILCIAIDDSEYHRLYNCLTVLFSEKSILGTVVVRNNPAGRSALSGFSLSHDYTLFAGANEYCTVGKLAKSVEQIARYDEHDEQGRFEWVNFRKHGGLNANREARPKLFYPIYVGGTGAVSIPHLVWDDQRGQWEATSAPVRGEIAVYPINAKGEEKTWKWGHETAKEKLSDLSCKPDSKGNLGIYMKSRMVEGTLPSTLWVDKKFSATEYGTNLLAHILGLSNTFPFPKSVHTVEDCLRVGQLHNNDYCIDFFAGSGTTGHATINLNREDGEQRKFILVEMGDHFDTVLLPRIKKVTFSPEWKDGKPKRMATPEEAKRSPRVVKYIRLESYEDALDSIKFDQPSEQLRLAEPTDEYLLKYMLRWETKGSESLLNASKLADPFSYRLQVHVNGEKQERTVDLAETFNFLLGLNVRKREVYADEGRRYLVYRGESRAEPGRKVAVIWRETTGWTEDDFARDRDFVAQNSLSGNADTVYVNGDSAIPDAKPIEPVFKDRMFASVNY